MSAAKYDVLPGNVRVSIVNKDGFSILLTVRDPITHLPVSIAGYSFVGGIYSSTWTKLADFTITLIDLPNGKVQASLTSIQTVSLGAGTFNWSFQWTDTSTQKRTIMGGAFIIVNG
jgi:hypothetical protein